MTKPSISITHDTRRPIKDGRFPVRILVTFKIDGIKPKWVSRYYGDGFYCTEREYATFSNPRSEAMRELKARVMELYSASVNIVNKHPHLTAKEFDTQLNGTAVDTITAMSPASLNSPTRLSNAPALAGGYPIQRS